MDLVADLPASLLMLGAGLSAGLVLAGTWHMRTLTRLRRSHAAELAQAEAIQLKALQDQLHGFRNALQTATALIGLQRDALKASPAAPAFDAAIGRFGAIGRFYQRRGETSGLIAFDAIVPDLLADCRMKHDPASKVQLTLELSPLRLPIDQAIALALLLHESATNAFRHAFATTERPQLTVRLTVRETGGVELSVTDNGRGIEEPQAEGLGLRIVSAFSRQLGARAVVARVAPPASGTFVSVAFRPAIKG